MLFFSLGDGMNVELKLSDSDVERIASAVAERLLATTNKASGSADQRCLLLTEADAAARLGVSRYSLRRWRQEGRIKSATTVRPILYRPADVDAIARWLEERKNE